MAWMICGTVPDASFPDGGAGVWWRLSHAEGRGHRPLSDLAQDTRPARNRIADVRKRGGASHGTARRGHRDGDGGPESSTTALRPPQPVRGAGITFHYLFPNLDGHSHRVLMALEETDPKPVLVAMPVFMYVAKMSGYADATTICSPRCRGTGLPCR